jgi:hypothetical protein
VNSRARAKFCKFDVTITSPVSELIVKVPKTESVISYLNGSPCGSTASTLRTIMPVGVLSGRDKLYELCTQRGAGAATNGADGFP